ncbi:MAG: transcriptional regulator, AlpA family [Candidatus Nitrotoga sp. SPKER]|nr:MAG: transcriptional regulator, AlpA family [Candidatus Nitrotoga sp. SPKER]
MSLPIQFPEATASNSFPTCPPRFIAIPEAMSRTALCKTSLYQLIKRGELRPVKLGKKTVFAEAEISEWINKRLAAREV